MTTLSSSTTTVNPRPERFVTVIPDGAVYRWQRSDGRALRSSAEAFLTLAEAVAAAVTVARCYNVPALAPALS